MTREQVVASPKLVIATRPGSLEQILERGRNLGITFQNLRGATPEELQPVIDQVTAGVGADPRQTWLASRTVPVAPLGTRCPAPPFHGGTGHAALLLGARQCGQIARAELVSWPRTGQSRHLGPGWIRSR